MQPDIVIGLKMKLDDPELKKYTEMPRDERDLIWDECNRTVENRKDPDRSERKAKTEEYRANRAEVNKIEKGMKPEPNREYYDNDIKFRTDEHARTVLVEGQLKNERSERELSAQRQIHTGDYDARPKDDAAHAVASQHGGYGGIINLTPMDAYLNRGGNASFRGAPQDRLLTKEERLSYDSFCEKARMENRLSHEDNKKYQELNEKMNIDDPASRYYNVDTYRDMEKYINAELKAGKQIYFQQTAHYEGSSKRPVKYDVNLIIQDNFGKTLKNSIYTFDNLDRTQRAKKQTAQRNEALKNNDASAKLTKKELAEKEAMYDEVFKDIEPEQEETIENNNMER
jgi:hypothetical protein